MKEFTFTNFLTNFLNERFKEGDLVFIQNLEDSGLGEERFLNEPGKIVSVNDTDDIATVQLDLGEVVQVNPKGLKMTTPKERVKSTNDPQGQLEKNFKMKNIKTFEQFVNERKINESNIQLIDQYIKSEEGKIRDFLVKMRGKFLHKNKISKSDMDKLKDIIPSISENLNELEDGVWEALNKGKVDDLIQNVKRGYGWIDPQYALYSYQGELNNKKERSEFFNILISKGLLYFSGDNPESKGMKVTSIKQITDLLEEGVNESEEEWIEDLDLNKNQMKKLATLLKLKKSDEEGVEYMSNVPLIVLYSNGKIEMPPKLKKGVQTAINSIKESLEPGVLEALALVEDANDNGIKKLAIKGIKLKQTTAKEIKVGDVMADGPGFATELAEVVKIKDGQIEFKITKTNWDDKSKKSFGQLNRPKVGDIIKMNWSTIPQNSKTWIVDEK